MKKIYLILVIVMGASFASIHAQTEDNNQQIVNGNMSPEDVKVNAHAFSKDDTFFDFYIGGPDLRRTLFRLGVKALAPNSDWKFGGSPLIGARASIGLDDLFGLGYDDMFSIGLEFNFTKYKAKFDKLSFYEGQYIDYDYKVKQAIYRGNLRLEFHPGVLDNPSLDIYFPAGIGIRYAKNEIITDDPTFSNLTNEVFRSAGKGSYRLGIGMRYYMADNIAFMAELGLGSGTLGQVGLTIKL